MYPGRYSTKGAARLRPFCFASGKLCQWMTPANPLARYPL